MIFRLFRFFQPEVLSEKSFQRSRFAHFKILHLIYFHSKFLEANSLNSEATQQWERVIHIFLKRMGKQRDIAIYSRIAAI